MEPVIQTKNLNIIYEKGLPSETHALKDINIEIYPEEYIAFFGPSGCGKSTLLYCIAGIETPTSGHVLVNGQDLTTLDNFEMSKFHRQQIGMIFQAYNLIPTLNVVDNVALPQVFEGAPRMERVKKGEVLLERFGIDQKKAHRLTQELSGGQQQRVGIARALINNPPIILADEPIGNLDTKSAQIVLDILYELNEKDKRTVILVTHEPRILSYAHRVVYMQDGRVLKVVNQKRAVVKLTPEAKKMPEAGDVRNDGEKLRDGQTKKHALAITSYILDGYPARQRHLFENLMYNLLKAEITWPEMLKKMAAPVSQGGGQFGDRQIDAISKNLEDIIFESNLFEDKTAKDFKYMPLDLEIAELRRSLLRFNARTLSVLQIKRLEEIIEDYLRQAIDRDIFEKIIVLSLQRGGLGLDRQTAQGFVKRMDVILERG
jgi:putative ABC transport system ATP-binding protein